MMMIKNYILYVYWYLCRYRDIQLTDLKAILQEAKRENTE